MEQNNSNFPKQDFMTKVKAFGTKALSFLKSLFKKVKNKIKNYFLNARAAQATTANVSELYESSSAAIPPRRKKVMFPVLKSLAWMFLIVAFSLFLSIFIIQSVIDVFGFESNDDSYEIVLTGNENLSDVLKILNERDIVSQTTAFKLYSKFKKWDNSFAAGSYTLTANMSYDEIISLLKNGIEVDNTVTVTIPEGLSVYEIAQLLEEKGVCKAEKFLNVLETADFGYEFVELIPQDELRFRRFEGYIFPDTYEFYIGENPTSVAKKFLRNFNTRVTSAYYDRFKELDLSLDEVITLASIIQKEAGELEQMYRVSSVFHNRLQSANFPNLQSDTTINYINNFIKPFLNSDNQAMYDAYNTNICENLPIGPISNPGLDAIKAALYPANTSYYYFVSDKTGEYYYAKTLKQHEENIRKAEKVNEQLEQSSSAD